MHQLTNVSRPPHLIKLDKFLLLMLYTRMLFTHLPLHLHQDLLPALQLLNKLGIHLSFHLHQDLLPSLQLLNMVDTHIPLYLHQDPLPSLQLLNKGVWRRRAPSTTSDRCDLL